MVSSAAPPDPAPAPPTRPSATQPSATQPSATWLRRALRARRVRVAVVAIAWAVVAVLWMRVQRGADAGAVATLQRAVDAARGAWWAVPVYVALGVARPLVFVPATLLTIAAGMLFGPVLGLAAAMVAANGSALLGYLIGRVLGPDGLAAEAPAPGSGGARAALSGWTDRLRTNSFEAVLLMRLLFLPYDAVHYLAGYLRVRSLPFLTATALGSLPGTVAFVLAGSSIERLDAADLRIDRRALAASVVVLVGSLVLARVLRRRTARAAATTPASRLGRTGHVAPLGEGPAAQ